MKKFLLILSMLLIVGSVSNAQNAELDSLIMIERDYVGDDTKHLKLLAKIINRLMPLNNEKCIEYCHKAIRISDVAGDLKRKTQALRIIGICQEQIGNIDSAFYFLNKSLATSQLAGDSLEMGDALNNIGVVYTKLYNLKAAQDYFQKAIMIYEKNTLLSGKNEELESLM